MKRKLNDKTRYILLVTVIMIIILAGFGHGCKYLSRQYFYEALTNGNTGRVETILMFSSWIANDKEAAIPPLQHAITLHFPEKDKDKRHELCELLIRYGADVNGTDATGQTALHYAARLGKQDIAELLLAEKANPYAQDKDGKTALQLASENNFENIVDAILAAEMTAAALNGENNQPDKK